MVFRPVLLSFALAAAALPAVPLLAQVQAEVPNSAARIAQLGTVLKIDQTLDIMRAEGLDYGSALETELFPGQGGAAWTAIVNRIYDTARMRQRFDAALTKALGQDEQAIAASEAFFGSPLGQRIVVLEIEARKTLLDKTAQTAADATWARMQAEKAPRVGQIERFAKVNDLIESNVMGALNANLAFYQGMSTDPAMADGMAEGDILAEVWGQEGQIRDETRNWLYPFLALAYQPLSDQDMADYIAFSETPAGQRVNAAVFAAFDAVFVPISGELGGAAARLMAGQDI